MEFPIIQKGIPYELSHGIPIIFILKNFDYPEKTLKYKHIRRISD